MTVEMVLDHSHVCGARIPVLAREHLARRRGQICEACRFEDVRELSGVVKAAARAPERACGARPADLRRAQVVVVVEADRYAMRRESLQILDPIRASKA